MSVNFNYRFDWNVSDSRPTLSLTVHAVCLRHRPSKAHDSFSCRCFSYLLFATKHKYKWWEVIRPLYCSFMSWNVMSCIIMSANFHILQFDVAQCWWSDTLMSWIFNQPLFCPDVILWWIGYEPTCKPKDFSQIVWHYITFSTSVVTTPIYSTLCLKKCTNFETV